MQIIPKKQPQPIIKEAPQADLPAGFLFVPDPESFCTLQSDRTNQTKCADAPYFLLKHVILCTFSPDSHRYSKHFLHCKSIFFEEMNASDFVIL